jgi:hypothetical protein
MRRCADVKAAVCAAFRVFVEGGRRIGFLFSGKICQIEESIGAVAEFVEGECLHGADTHKAFSPVMRIA